MLEIEHGKEDIPFFGFTFDTSNSIFSVRVDNDFVTSSAALHMMRKMSYMPSLGLGKNQQGPHAFNIVGVSNDKHGPGYTGAGIISKKEKKMLIDCFVKEVAKLVF